MRVINSTPSSTPIVIYTDSAIPSFDTLDNVRVTITDALNDNSTTITATDVVARASFISFNLPTTLFPIGVVSGTIVTSVVYQDAGATIVSVIDTDDFRFLAGVAAADANPVQDAAYSYSNFLVAPSDSYIERYDAGTINAADTYPSPNRGWNFVDSVAQIPLGSDGTLVGHAYTIDTDDTDIQLAVALNYQFATDLAETTTINSANAWSRESSVRGGSIATTNLPAFLDNDDPIIGLRNLSNFVGTGKTLLRAVNNPNNTVITIPGLVDDYIYLMYADNHPDLVSIEQSIFNTNVLSRFTKLDNLGGFKIYVLTDPLSYSGPIILTLKT